MKMSPNDGISIHPFPCILLGCIVIIVSYCIALYSIILYCTVLYCIVLCRVGLVCILFYWCECYSDNMITLMCLCPRVWPFHPVYPLIHSLVHPSTLPPIHPFIHPSVHPPILTAVPICLLQVAMMYMGSKELVHRCVDKSLKDLQVDYMDLYLIHYPCGFKVRFGH